MTDKEMTDKFEKAKKDVGRVFSNPNDIVSENDLSREQKIDLLLQWELDLREKMVASEEGMNGADAGRDAVCLGLIQSLLSGLGHKESNAASVNKAG